MDAGKNVDSVLFLLTVSIKPEKLKETKLPNALLIVLQTRASSPSAGFGLRAAGTALPSFQQLAKLFKGTDLLSNTQSRASLKPSHPALLCLHHLLQL